jgi:hypothetical protein
MSGNQFVTMTNEIIGREAGVVSAKNERQTGNEKLSDETSQQTNRKALEVPFREISRVPLDARGHRHQCLGAEE